MLRKWTCCEDIGKQLPSENRNVYLLAVYSEYIVKQLKIECLPCVCGLPAGCAGCAEKGKEGESFAEVRDEDLLPLAPTRLSFWAKLWEVQLKMLLSHQDTELEHKFSSSPTEWPFMVRNIAYWMSPSSNVSALLSSSSQRFCQLHP